MDVAQFGVVIHPPTEGEKQTVESFKNVSKAADDSARSVESSAKKKIDAYGAEAAAARRLGMTTADYMASMSARQAAFAGSTVAAATQVVTAHSKAAAGIVSLGTAATQSGGGLVALGKAHQAAATGAQQHTSFLTKLKDLIVGPFAGGMRQGVTEVEKGTKAHKEHGFALADNIGKIIAWVGAVTAGYLTVKTAIEQFKKSIEQAANMEDLQFALVATIGNAEKAQEVFNKIREMPPVFKVEQWGEAAVSLLNIGISSDEVTDKLTQLGNIASRQGRPIEQITQAYLRAVEQGRVTYRQMYEFGQAGIVLWPELAKAMGKSQHEVEEIARRTGIDIKFLDIALKNAATSGGAFAGTLEGRLRTFHGQISALKVAWDDFLLAAFGSPINQQLKSPIQSITQMIRDAVPDATRFGEKVSWALGMFNDWIKDANKFDVLYAGWQVVIDKMANYFREKLTQARVDFMRGFFGPLNTPAGSLGDALGDATEKHIRESVALTKTQVEEQQQHLTTLNILLGKYGDIKATLFEISKIPPPQITDQFSLQAGVGGTTTGLSLQNFGNIDLGKSAPDWGLPPHPPPAPVSPGSRDRTGGHSEWDRFKTDVDIINKYWEDYNIIMSKSTSATERQRRIEELTFDVAKTLYDPTLLAPWAKGLEALILKEQEHAKQMQAMELRIRVGAASAGDSFSFGIRKALDAWGNASQQFAQLGEQITNRIGDGFSNAFGELITGTKDAKTAFRDMAVSILQDIAKMIVRMLILRAIQALVGMFGGAASTGQAMASNTSWATGLTGGYARGGYTGQGREGEYAGAAHRGEFYFSQEQVRNIGLDRLYMLQSSASKGSVTTSRAQGVDPGSFEVEPGFLPGVGRGRGHDEPGGPSSIDIDPTSGGANHPHSAMDFRGDAIVPRDMNQVDIWNIPGNQPHGSMDYYHDPGNAPHSTSDYYSGHDFPSDSGQADAAYRAGLGDFLGDTGRYVGYGTTPFSGFRGSPSLYSTTWSYEPGLGIVPRAQAVSGGGGGGGSTQGSGGGTFALGGMFGTVGGSPVQRFHGGGIVGQHYGVPYMVDMSLFDHARRMHSGGIAGNEEAIIAKHGEIVSTPQQWNESRQQNTVQLTVIYQDGQKTSRNERSQGDPEAPQKLKQELERFMDSWSQREVRHNGRMARR